MRKQPVERRPNSEQLASGVMDLLVLRVVADGQTYGYEIAQTLTLHGLEGVHEASVYTAVNRLEKNGSLESNRILAENGRARRYYQITAKGLKDLDSRSSTWSAMASAVESVLATGTQPDPSRQRTDTSLSKTRKSKSETRAAKGAKT